MPDVPNRPGLPVTGDSTSGLMVAGGGAILIGVVLAVIAAKMPWRRGEHS